jgi:diguanylate cyclase (GGDEF)-like protein
VSDGDDRGRHSLWHALELFERAIEAAHAAGYLNNEALAYELAGVLRAEHGLERPAAFYMNEARYLWRKWGAAAKVRQLECRWPRLLSTLYHAETRGWHDGTATLASIAPPDCEVSASSDALDMISILHASQSLAEELRLEGLLNRMMAILMENAGADRCVLMLAEPRRWVAKAESRTSWPGPSRLPDPDIESLPDALPLTLVHYCIRTRQQVVLADASADRTYRKDPYFSASAMKSVLCLPLALRGELLGLVYLENNLMTGAFTQSRRRVLDLLSGQMAISIQNAEFYTHLEDMVDQRTGELTQVNERLQQANAELQQLSTTDGLTGVANRRCFDDFLEREWIRHARRQWPLAILLCDIDHFKLYNDTHGHLAGDDCLIRIVGALGTAAGRAGDLVARYGGDELVVVLTETGEIGLSAVIDRIQERVASLEIPHAASPVDRFVTLSIGACWGIPAGVGWCEAVAIADRALYVAKARGRNRSVISALVPA